MSTDPTNVHELNHLLLRLMQGIEGTACCSATISSPKPTAAPHHCKASNRPMPRTPCCVWPSTAAVARKRWSGWSPDRSCTDGSAGPRPAESFRRGGKHRPRCALAGYGPALPLPTV